MTSVGVSSTSLMSSASVSSERSQAAGGCWPAAGCQPTFTSGDMERLFRRYIYTPRLASLRRFVALLLTLNVAMATLDMAYARALTVHNVCHMSLASVFAVLLGFLFTRHMEPVQVRPVVGLTLLLAACFYALCLPLHSALYRPTSGPLAAPVDGVWQVAWLVFALYAFMPIATHFLVLVGVLLSLVHTIVAAVVVGYSRRRDDATASGGPFPWREVGEPTSRFAQ